MKSIMKRKLLMGMAVFLVIALAYFYEKTYYPLPGPVREEGPPPFLRLHVVAHSNSERDQEIKLDIRDLVLADLHSGLYSAQNYEEAREYTRVHLPDLEKRVEKKLESSQCSYGVKGQVILEDFQETRYGIFRFPAGRYWSLRLTLGDGLGRNWWCVLYPPMCFIDLNKAEPVSVMAPVSGQAKDEDRDPWQELRTGIKRELRKVWLLQ